MWHTRNLGHTFQGLTMLKKDVPYKHPSISKIGWLLGKIDFKDDAKGGGKRKVNIFRKYFSLFSQAWGLVSATPKPPKMGIIEDKAS